MSVKQILHLLRDYKKLILVVLFAFTVRIFLLGEFPVGITHDELNYIVAAKSLFYTGNFAPGTPPAVFPSQMSFSTVTVAEIPSYILSVFLGPLNLNLFTARLLGALFSSLSILLLYFLVKEITKNEIMSLSTALVAAINPWSFLTGRTVFEVNFYIFFLLFGFLLLLLKSGWKIFYSAPFFILGFLSYTGGQITFYLFIVGALILNFVNLRRKKIIMPYVILTFLFTFLLVGYIYSVSNNQSGTTRGGELYLPNSQDVSRQVNYERLVSVPFGLNRLFINKATIYTQGFFEKYLDAFSTSILFVNGEVRAAFSYQKHGTFYIIDAIFIILGIAILYSKNKRIWWFFIFTLLVSPITSGISTVEHSFTQRSGLIYPFLIMFVGIGLGGFIQSIRNISIKKLFTVLIFSAYMLFFTNLLHIFFYRFPVYASDGWFFQDRILARYINLSLEDENVERVLVSTFEPKIVFQEYLFYSGLYNKREDIEKVNVNLDKKIFQYGPVNFHSECPAESDLTDKTVWIYDGVLNCKSEKSKTRITRYRDVYEQYLIVNDKVCSKEVLNNYVYPEAFRDFKVDYQDSQKFCQSWITRI